MLIKSLEAGKSVYVEKPLAISVDELKSVSKAFSGSDQIMMVGYNRRYSSSVNYLKKKLKKDIPYSIYYQVNAGFIPKDNWYQSPEQGGRIIGECGHFVDTLQYLLDADPVEVFASTSEVPGMPEQDNTFISIKFSNGSTGVIAYLADGDKNYPKEKIMVSGFKTNIEFDNFRSVTSFKNGKASRKKFALIDKGQKKEMSVLADAVKTGTMPVNFDTLVKNSYATILAVESIKTKKSYKLDISDIQ